MTETKTKQSIKTAVHEHYESAELSEAQLENLQKLQATWQSESMDPHEKLKAMEAHLASRASGSTPAEKILSIQEGLDPENMPSISTSFQYQQPKTSRSKLPLLWFGLLLTGALGAAWYFL